ncbi:hypothetical protein [[Clostridium] fimetarium]|uniref:Uncharacterized protein n=1 Tax=[Clostridium] fimetarium TaxID=99656 RepID=A0A1I0M5Z8_9FIRM|nr:hypothetical protein [[Clostridium] fimetarium]SEV83146.1 hypothetical protein SAMN05421659_101172 [[Clostridium] fimetarium]
MENSGLKWKFINIDNEKNDEIDINHFLGDNIRGTDDVDEGVKLIQAIGEIYYVLGYEKILEKNRYFKENDITKLEENDYADTIENQDQTNRIKSQMDQLSYLDIKHQNLLWITFTINNEYNTLSGSTRDRDELFHNEELIPYCSNVLRNNLRKYNLESVLYLDEWNFVRDNFIKAVLKTVEDIYKNVSLDEENYFRNILREYYDEGMENIKDIYKNDNIYFSSDIFRKCLQIIKSEIFGEFGKRIWFSILCDTCISLLEEGERSYHHIPLRYLDFNHIDSEEFWSHISDLTEMISEYSTYYQQNIQSDMMFCCMMEKPVKRPNVYQNLSRLRKILELDFDLKNKYLNKHVHSCFAILHADTDKFVALSGYNEHDDYNKKLKKILEVIVDSNYRLVESIDKVRYYYDAYSGHYIVISDYEKVSKEVNKDLQNMKIADSKLNRLFSCCERKLLSQLRQRKYKNVCLIIQRKPCFMCERAIRYEGRIPYENGKEYSKQYSEKEIILFDKIAYLILKRKNERNDNKKVSKQIR